MINCYKQKAKEIEERYYKQSTGYKDWPKFLSLLSTEELLFLILGSPDYMGTGTYTEAEYLRRSDVSDKFKLELLLRECD